MTHALEIDRVSLGYPQGGAVKTVLHDFDLAVRSGELVSLLGASGVGKSSLLRVLAGLKQALSGQVRLFGEPFSRPHPRVGLVFQSAALLPWLNVRDNLAFGLDFKRQPLLGEAERKRRVNDALEEVGLAHAAQKYPSELSGGFGAGSGAPAAGVAAGRAVFGVGRGNTRADADDAARNRATAQHGGGDGYPRHRRGAAGVRPHRAGGRGRAQSGRMAA